MLGGGSWGTVGNRVAGHGVNTRGGTRLPPPPYRRCAPPGPGLYPSRHRARSREAHNLRRPARLQPVDRAPSGRGWRPGLTVAGYWWPTRTPNSRPNCGTSSLRAELRVFVGLGSATVPDPERLSAEIVRAPAGAGLRGGDPARLGRPRSGR
ncbi:hypothetical protein ACRAWF_33100 [Streptomyces sp. L7]